MCVLLAGSALIAGLASAVIKVKCDGVAVTVDLTRGEEPTEGDDVIRGTYGPDVLDGRGGDDLICGMGGDDLIRGGDGDDRLLGGGGDDQLFGDDGLDVLIGGEGAVYFNGGIEDPPIDDVCDDSRSDISHIEPGSCGPGS